MLVVEIEVCFVLLQITNKYMMSEVLNFSAQQTRDNLSMKELISSVERGLANFSDHESGGVVQPVRTVFKVENLDDKPAG